jgi:hypothetical protein
MVPRPRRCHKQQSTNMMRDKSMPFKLDNIIVFTIYKLCNGMPRRQHIVSVFACCGGCHWPISAIEKLR